MEEKEFKERLEYKDFWDWFLTMEKKFFEVVKEGEQEAIEKDFFNIISPKLNQVNEGYYFLTGMFDEDTAELIITVEGEVKNIVFAEELIVAAPKLNHWIFRALKPAIDIQNLNIELGEHKFSKDTVSFYANEQEEYPDEIDLVFVYQGTAENKKAVTTGVCVLLDNFLGELNFATQIDTFTVIGIDQAEKELVPIEKLKDFLDWREREFIEKYKSIERDDKEEKFSILRAYLENSRPLIACMNLSLLQYDAKASYPWVSVLKIHYNGDDNDGLPEKEDFEKLNDIENKAIEELKKGGYLYIGRESADNIKESFFVGKDFRRASKVFKTIRQDNPGYKISFGIFKDKYWQYFKDYENAH
ncbi:hypothetical protein J2810_003005 [Chryseobacterium rhizosphaerae]|jgi:hypothetical protein|uniref:DUF695 domain-containing protein n=1 Tax=Chryseobacterium rhizosphaerae TaxID=395937 RepID=UPI002856AEC0|nr:DUF695 domain-containing protein [Chryseobacterium rhizosphaerae]MDR6546936.1 hypothetical protein [Chryseobacterium rhizosphaerae]